MSNKKGIIVSTLPGMGKTTLARKHDNIIDLESSDYQWKLTKEQEELTTEERKGQPKEKHEDWPRNYYAAIEEAVKKYDYVLTSVEGVKYAKFIGAPVYLFHPTKDQKEEYLYRLEERGNQPLFIKLVDEKFEEWIDGYINDKKATVFEVEQGYLEDAFIKYGLL